MRHHLLEGLLRRLAASPVIDDFVVRGGLMTRMWSPGRTTRDLDLVGDHPFDVERTTERLRAICRVSVDDGLQIDADTLRSEGIWLHTAFPGVRARIPVAFGSTAIAVTADVGFGDPLVPPAEWIDYPTLVGDPPRVRACALECQAAWKLHGLAENRARYRPKDLADLARIARVGPLDTARMVPAIVSAFASRGYALHQAVDILYESFWATRQARARWTDTGAPGTLTAALAVTREALAPALAALPTEG